MGAIMTALTWYPHIRADLLADKLRWQLCKQESNTEESLSRVEIVCVKTQIIQEVICVSLTDVTARQIECKKRYSSPDCNPPVKLADDWNFLSPCPALVRVESVKVLIPRMRLVKCSEPFIVKDRRLCCNVIEAEPVVPSFPECCESWTNGAGVIVHSLHVYEVTRWTTSIKRDLLG
jgi:hypothetical protein